MLPTHTFRSTSHLLYPATSLESLAWCVLHMRHRLEVWLWPATGRHTTTVSRDGSGRLRPPRPPSPDTHTTPAWRHSGPRGVAAARARCGRRTACPPWAPAAAWPAPWPAHSTWPPRRSRWAARRGRGTAARRSCRSSTAPGGSRARCRRCQPAGREAGPFALQRAVTAVVVSKSESRRRISIEEREGEHHQARGNSKKNDLGHVMQALLRTHPLAVQCARPAGA